MKRDPLGNLIATIAPNDIPALMALLDVVVPALGARSSRVGGIARTNQQGTRVIESGPLA